jgi:hypothetical protein
MKSSKWMIGLVAVVLMLALAPNSFAQIQIQLFNTPSAGEITTNHNAQTADPTSPGAGLLVSGQLIAASSLTTTQLTLTFPGPITSSASALDGTIAGVGVVIPRVPSTNDAIRIEGATGLFASVTAVASVNYWGGTITVTLPGFPPPAGNSISGSFRISGIRLDLENRSAPLNVTGATLSSSANNYIAPTSLPTLISAVGAGIGSFTQATLSGATNLGTALMFANQSVTAAADGTASILITEGFASAWRTATQTATTGLGTDVPNGSNILLTIAGIPAGITAALSRTCVGSTTACATTTVALTSAALTSAAPTTTISFLTTDMTAVESLSYALIFTGPPTTVPMATGSITLAATMTPNSTTGLTGSGAGGGVPTTSGGLPRFETSSTTITVGVITPATTTMLAPFVAKVGTTFDTGLAIANTTLDPFTTGGATPSGGTIIFDLFPRLITGTTGGAGTRTTITTSASVRPGGNGGGLDAAGSLAAGGTWSATLSELQTAGSITGDFIGYIFIQTNFVDAHGVAYIIQNGVVTSAVPLLVLQPPLAQDRDTTTAEVLGF